MLVILFVINVGPYSLKILMLVLLDLADDLEVPMLYVTSSVLVVLGILLLFYGYVLFQQYNVEEPLFAEQSRGLIDDDDDDGGPSAVMNPMSRILKSSLVCCLCFCTRSAWLIYRKNTSLSGVEYIIYYIVGELIPIMTFGYLFLSQIKRRSP